MKLNHLNLSVNHMAEAISFFQKIFDFQLIEQKGDAIGVMDDGHDFVLVLSNLRSKRDKETELSYPRDFHVGFYVETMSEVDQFCEKLKKAGYAPENEPKKIRGGYTLYFRALEHILFEVTCLNAKD